MKKLNLKWKKISNKLYSLLKYLEGAKISAPQIEDKVF